MVRVGDEPKFGSLHRIRNVATSGLDKISKEVGLGTKMNCAEQDERQRAAGTVGGHPRRVETGTPVLTAAGCNSDKLYCSD